MRADDVLAVVVSFNGRDKTRAAVEALRGQVGRVLIVDNGSDADSLVVLDTLERERGVHVERLGANRGIGYALNVGARHAREGRFTWLLTMDQDSVVDSTFIAAFRAAIEHDPNHVCLAPTIPGKSGATQQGGVVAYAITSGNLVRVDVLDSIGGYDEGLFIDCIDFDFSLRVRRAGYAVHRVPGATMRHQLGESVEARMPRLVRRFYDRHSPVRRYYMYRNYLYMVERYARDFPTFILKLTVTQLVLAVLIGVLDPTPLESYRAIARGIRHYAARKTGPYALSA